MSTGEVSGGHKTGWALRLSVGQRLLQESDEAIPQYQDKEEGNGLSHSPHFMLEESEVGQEPRNQGGSASPGPHGCLPVVFLHVPAHVSWVRVLHVGTSVAGGKAELQEFLRNFRCTSPQLSQMPLWQMVISSFL